MLLPGDGIGVEVMTQARALLELVAAKLDVMLELEEIPCGGKYYLEHGARDWPENAEYRCASADAILLGAVGWSRPGDGGPVLMTNGHMAGYSAVIGNRVNLDLYANVRPVRLLPGVRHKISGSFRQVWSPQNVDMVMVRENTEDLYCDLGGTLRRAGVAELATDTRVITRTASHRILRRAFEICDRRSGAPADGVKRVTCIVKNNVMEGCRLFAEVCREVAQDYPNIETEFAIVDAFTQWLVTQPERYDVCVTTNMFGDIVTDLASVLQGGMGMAVGCNLGDDHAMFEPIHGSAPPLAGKDTANPMAMLLATGECLAWLGQRRNDARLERAASAVSSAVTAVTDAGAPLTADLSATPAGLCEVAAAVLARVDARLA